MYNKKGQINLISLFIILAFSLFFVSAAYFWVFPNIQQMTSVREIERMENQMVELHKAISQVSREQSQRIITFQIQRGTIRVRNTSILYSGDFELPESLKGAESIVFGGIYTPSRISCDSNEIGELGEDEPVCLLRRGDIELELRYLRLNDTSSGNIYGINFMTTSTSRVFAGEGTHQVVVSWINKTTNSNSITKNLKVEFY